MADEVEPVIRGIEKRFRDLSVRVRGERIIRYIVNQLRLGRHLDAILQDSYMLSHTSEAERAQLLENPEVIEAMEQEIHKQFAGYQSATKKQTKDIPSE